jgi:hypothetical protein
MKIIYSDQPIQELLQPDSPSVFLAGPTPRDEVTPSWRPNAIALLKAQGFQGQVLVPERSNKSWKVNYDDQVEWEDYGLVYCSKIAFWIPRNMTTMIALTTNVEFGRFHADRRTLYGRPDDAPRCRYLDWLFRKYNNGEIYNSLSDLMKQV